MESDREVSQTNISLLICVKECVRLLLQIAISRDFLEIPDKHKRLSKRAMHEHKALRTWFVSF